MWFVLCYKNRKLNYTLTLCLVACLPSLAMMVLLAFISYFSKKKKKDQLIFLTAQCNLLKDTFTEKSHC